MMKMTRFLILGCLLMATITARAQITDPGWFNSQNGNVQVGQVGSIETQKSSQTFTPLLLPPSGAGSPSIAEASTPQIQALAQGLQNSWSNIFNYVNSNIRYVHYFGSKKGAQLTLLEKSGNDFDQCALLVALLRSAGYTNTGYQFGWEGVPYDDPSGQNIDLHHWFQLSFFNTNWNYTSNYLFSFFGKRGYPLAATTGTNTFIFQRVWVTLTNNGTTYYLDPAFKISVPIAGISLPVAMGYANNATASNALMSAAGGTDTGNYVTNLTESALRNSLTVCTTNLVAYIQSNYPNASVQQIIGGQQIVPYGGTLIINQQEWYKNPDFPIYTVDGDGTTNWVNEPTNMMSSLTITFARTNYQWWIPQLLGQRISLIFSPSGGAQLWQDDALLVTNTAGGSSSTTNVVISVNHPVGTWDTINNVLVDNGKDDQVVTNSYQRTNSTYAIIYAFEPDWGWLQQRENMLDSYRQQGLADTSRQVVSETLNVMGLNWMLQTAGADQMAAAQDGVLPQYYHRVGRMAQENGKGYYVDVYMQESGSMSGGGADAANTAIQNNHFDLFNYFASALEHGVLEQLQSSNLVASSTVKMLELANTNGQSVFLASSTNWTTNAKVSSKLVNYDKTTLTTLTNDINEGYYILLPQNGSNHVAGAGTWAGYGYAERLLTSTNESMTMKISGGYNGGYIYIPGVTVDPNTTSGDGNVQIDATTTTPPSTPNPPTLDPVDTADGTFQVEHTDLSLGQTEPRGITLSRYYNGTRRYMNPSGMAPGWIHNYCVNADTVAEPQVALGGTTPAQAAPMIAATCAALGLYNSANPDPKNWMVTALIAKWGIDQLTRGGVSVVLGKDTLQFVKQPDGSYTPPGNCTMTLIQTNSNYWLQERHGRTFQFDTLGRLTDIVDQYNNSLSLTYNTSNWVSTVKDWKSRTFTFNYTGSQLTSVADNSSPSRSIFYGYNASGDLTSFTDAEGKISNYAYDTNHEITATYDALNNLIVTNFYDGFGHITSQLTEDYTNRTWQMFWSGWQNVEIDPVGGQRTYSYDNQGRFVSLLDELGNLTQTVYDGQNHVIETISPLNETNQYIYDGNNNLTNAIDPLGFTTQYIYDGNNNLIATIDGRGDTNSFGYNAQFSVIGQTNGAGDFVNYSYTTSGALAGTLASKTDSGGTTTYNYDSTYGQLTNITYPGSLGSEGFVNSSLGDVTSHTDANGNITSYQYNKRRELTVTTMPTNLTVSVLYDAVGNVVTNTDARGNSTVSTWSPTRKLLATALPVIPAGPPMVTNNYDGRDLLITTHDPLSNATSYTNDLAQRLIAVTDPLLRTTKFGYDADGRKTAITNAILERTLYQLDGRSELTMLTNPTNKTVLRAYDGAGNQIILTNRNGKIWKFNYDGANRLVSTITPLGYSNVLTFNHQGLLQTLKDQAGQTTTNGYDAKGRLTSRADSFATTAFGYDANNNPTNVMEPGITNSWTYDAYNRVSSYSDVYGYLIQYRYDANGNVTNLIYPGGKNVYYSYDSENHMTNVTDWASRQTSITYDLNGRVTSITRPNGTKRTIGYDAAGQTTNIVELLLNGLPIALYQLGWDNAARVSSEFGAPLPHAVTVTNRTMTYDADNRLLNVDGNGVTLDNDGNLLNGPLTNDTFAAYAYDARNRLRNVGGVTNTYDAMNNRIGQTQGTNSTIFVVNPNAKLPQVLMRIKNGVTNYYVYGVGLLYQVTETVAATNTLTYHYDYRGSTIALSDNNGNVTDRIEYSIYATTTYRIGTNDTPFLFNGRFGVQTDPNGLLYMRARYYNPFLCRFINPDPAGFSGGLNFFAYANGNPVSYLDPFGLGAQGANDNYHDFALNTTSADLDTLGSDNAVSTLNQSTTSGTTGTSGGTYETVSTVGGTVGLSQSIVQYGSGAVTVGDNGVIYLSGSGGNQYLTTAKIGAVAEGLSPYLYYGSVVTEGYGAVTGQVSPGTAAVNTGVAYIGFRGGVPGAIFAGSYFIVNAVYPGGAINFLVDMGHNVQESGNNPAGPGP